ncbi:MAG: gamma-glutamyltransferase family protein [Alphaproteobacteria bacterium]|nr:gamma-glutamyltransferase family protein [Alphaproteobacteria bacterium]
MFTTRPEIRGTFGMVASTHYLATMAGWAMLEKGGNAFDAAVATGLALQVVQPYQNGPGGDLPIVLHNSATGKTEVICGQGVSPQAATIDRFRQLGLDLVPGTGLLAPCVPGAFGAWMLLLRDYGTLSLSDVIQPTIDYGRNGYAVVPMMHTVIDAVAELFRSAWPTSAATYLVDGEPPKVGTLHRNPVLADTYARLLREAEAQGGNREDVVEAARHVFYEGFIAEEIDRFCRQTEWLDSSGEAHGGLLTGDDMARWRATVEAPATYDYHGYTLCKPGPWSQGPVFLQQLALLKGFDLAAMDPMGPDFIHTQVECAKLALADREAWYGDPNVHDIPLQTLLSESYNDARRKLIATQASLELRPGSPDGREPHLAEFEIADPDNEAELPAGAGEPNAARGRTVEPTGETAAVNHGPADGDTVHLDAADQLGNMVSCMPSGGWLQSSPVIPALGFCLGTRAQMFWLQEGYPTTLQPGIRPRTTLSPTLALRDGAPALAFGTPGGDAQDQWALTMFLRHIHHGMDLQAAIDAPIFHTDHLPSSFYPRTFQPAVVKAESRLPSATIDALRDRGHRMELVDDWALGRMTAIGREKTDGGWLLKGAAHPRFQEAYAVGR